MTNSKPFLETTKYLIYHVPFYSPDDVDLYELNVKAFNKSNLDTVKEIFDLDNYKDYVNLVSDSPINNPYNCTTAQLVMPEG